MVKSTLGVYSRGMISIELLEAFLHQLSLLGSRICLSPGFNPSWNRAGPCELLIRECLDQRWAFTSDSPGLVVTVTLKNEFPELVVFQRDNEWHSPRDAADSYHCYAMTCLSVKAVCPMLLYFARELKMSEDEVARRIAAATASTKKKSVAWGLPEGQDRAWAKGFLEG